MLESKFTVLQLPLCHIHSLLKLLKGLNKTPYNDIVHYITASEKETV